MLVLIKVDRILHYIGRQVAVIVLLIFSAAIVLGAVAVALGAAIIIAEIFGAAIGGGIVIYTIIFFTAAVLFGWYVAPYVQPNIGAAVTAMTDRRTS